MNSRAIKMAIAIACCAGLTAGTGIAAEKVAVLTFDDASASHSRYVAPLLKQYGFGATFYVGEYPGFDNKTNYMTWAEISQLNAQGFEIGNHTLTHKHVDRMNRAELIDQLVAIEQRCASNTIPRPVSFAYPAYVTNAMALAVLQERGYRTARVGGGRAYQPGLDNPLLIPSVSGSGAKTNRVIEALAKVQPGQIVVFTFHGAPDLAHPQVTVPPETFQIYLDYLRANHFKVIAMRDLDRLNNKRDVSK